MELFIEDGKQCSKQLWEDKIDALKQETIPSDKEKLKAALHDAIKSRLPNEKCGLFLSGGVDSSYIALKLKEYNADFVCYTVGIENSPDLDKSIALAKELNLNHVHKTLSLDEVEVILKKLAPWYLKDERLKDENLAVLFGVAAVEYAAAGLMINDDINIVFGGLGSEEIFAGYKRHEDSKDINEECWTGLKNMWQRDLIRDCILAGKFNLDVRTPLLDANVIKQAMGIGGKLKIVNNVKKHVFREISLEEGLPEQFAFRKKLGAQYGSKMDKAISKLAKRAGFQYKADYLRSLV